MVYKTPSTRLGRSFPPTSKPLSIPASVGGINALDSYAAMPPQDCIYTYNLMPVEYGLQLRKGWRKWATGVNGGVRTVIAYESNSGDSTDNRLWAVSENGIYDVTTDGETSPNQDVSFSVQGDAAGFGTWVEYTNDASRHYLFYADYENGLHQYEENTGTWSVPSSGTLDTDWYYLDSGGSRVAFPVDEIAFVMVHKLRIWVILRESSDAWYLPVASVAGELKKFTFGAKMKYGGQLQGLWTWTLDGGDGVDDYLVAVSRGGDVMVYRGGDPASDFALNGNWFIGATPASRRIAQQYGSEMYVLSSFGLTSMRDLLQGSAADNVRTSASAKVNRPLRAAIARSRTEYEWSIFLHPGDGFMQIVAPVIDGEYIQYNNNLNTKAWGYWEDVPILCAETFVGEYYMGAAGEDEGEVYLYSGVKDDRELDGSGGEAIGFRVLTSFQSVDNPSFFKNVVMIRAVGLLSANTSITLKAVYDFDVQETLEDAAGVGSASDSSWDAAIWDDAAWTFDIGARNFIRGSYGIGRTVAVGMRGLSESRIDVISWDLMIGMGGFL